MYSILSNMDEKQLPVLHTGKKSSFVSPNSGQMTVLFLPDHLPPYKTCIRHE